MPPTVAVSCMKTFVLSYNRELNLGQGRKGQRAWGTIKYPESRKSFSSVLQSAETQISRNPGLTNSCACRTTDLVLSQGSLKFPLTEHKFAKCSLFPVYFLVS